jgi:phage-related protein
MLLTVSRKDKPLAWLHGEVKTPPFSLAARLETGYLLRRLQRGDILTMPQSRPMSSVGARCHELRINDVSAQWRLIYRIDADAIVIAEVFVKKSAKKPKTVLETCRRRLKEYDNAGK